MTSTRAPRPGTARRFARGLAAGAAAAALLVTGCAAGEPSPSDSDAAATLDRIIISTPTPPGTPAGAPVWIGEKIGFFAEEGLDVQIVTFPGRPSDAVATVVAGQSDLVISVPDALIVPTANGDDLGLTWAFTPYQRPSFVVAVAADSDIETAADLEGATVAMPSQGAPFETFLNANIEDEGGDPSTVTAVTLAPNAALESMRNGIVDAVVLNRGELALAAQVTGYQAKELPLAPAVEQGIAAGFMMRTDVSDERRDVYARYLRAYLKSAIFAQENPEAAVRLSWELYPESKSTEGSEEDALAAAVAMMRATVDEFVPAADGTWGLITQERWESYVANLGLSDKLPDVSVLFDNSLLERISDFDEDAVREEARSFAG